MNKSPQSHWTRFGICMRAGSFLFVFVVLFRESGAALEADRPRCYPFVPSVNVIHPSALLAPSVE